MELEFGLVRRQTDEADMVYRATYFCGFTRARGRSEDRRLASQTLRFRRRRFPTGKQGMLDANALRELLEKNGRAAAKREALAHLIG